MTHSAFLVISHNSIHYKRYAWASRIIPRSNYVENLCENYGVVEKYPSGAFDVIIERGSLYPDCLGCGSYPFFIVSKRVVDLWHGHGIKCFDTFPVKVADVKSKKLQTATPPDYFRIEVTGSCRVSLEGSGLKVIRQVPKCHYLVTDPPVPNKYVFEDNSWSGDHLFRDVELYPRVVFCTEKMLSIASDNKLSNFRFEWIVGPFSSQTIGVDYLRKGKG